MERVSTDGVKSGRGAKLTHDIDRMMAAIRAAVRPLPKAMLFELRDRGHGSPYEQLVACVLSIRTLDEVSLGAALRLLREAPDLDSLSRMALGRVAELIAPCTFAGQKSESLLKIARLLEDEHGGRVPCDFEGLTALPGIGPKCANLILGVACGEARIGVDIHVHRVTNRWGYVAAPTPEKTLAALEGRLPRKYWVEINERLVPFGKHICTGQRPNCSVCPVLRYCRQVGVRNPR